MISKSLSDTFKKRGYIILNFDHESLNDLKKIQKNIIESKISTIKNKNIFYKSSLKLQNKIYKTGFHKKVLKRNISKIIKILGVRKYSDLSVTAFVHLRSVKKVKRNNKNFIGFHRETFYFIEETKIVR